ncbi:MAG: hypothetical protein D6706_11170 [Chloroflexi bacterium]|nr:MAG: hypothetical protein D6706_11170 [Chloroflexota bacterium]
MSEKVASGHFEQSSVSAAALAAYNQGRAAARRQDYPQAITYFTEALAFEGTPDLFRARTLEYRGQCYWLLGKFNEAEADYEAALAASDDMNQIARARARLGELADFCGRYEQAEKLYQQALAEGVQAGNLLVIGRAQRGLGVLNRRRGNTEQAVSHLTQALAAFRQVGEAREQARVLTSLGRTRHARGEYQYALSAHQEALMILESLEDRWRIIQCLNDIGECHQALYDIETALSYHERALQMAEESNANLLKPEIYRNLGVDLVEQSEYDKGIMYLQKALEGARQFGNREQEALTLYHLTRAFIRHGWEGDAVQTVSRLSEVAEALDADRFRALAAFARGELLFAQGERVAAIAELNAAMLAAQTAVDRGVLWKLHATMGNAIDDEAIAAVHRNIAAEFVRQTAEPIQDERLKRCFVYAPPVLAVLQAAGIDPDKL